MTGTIINIITVLVGGIAGNTLGARLSDKIRQTVVTALGLITLLLGVQMFLKTQNVLVVLGSILCGALLGEWWHIEEGLKNVGIWLENKFVASNAENSQARFVKGFLLSSLVFCIGPMTFLGSFQDGLTGDYSLLVIKSVMDGFAAMAFASSLGVGVVFSTIVILVYQGGLSLLATQLQALITTEMMGEMSAVGGVILAGLAIGSLLEIRPIRTASLLPGLLLAPFFVVLMKFINLY